MKEKLVNELVSRLSTELNIDNQIVLYNIVSQSLDGFIISEDISNIVKYDIRQVVGYFMDCKNTESLSNGTLAGYKRVLTAMLCDVSGYMDDINVNVFRHYISTLTKSNKMTTVINKVTIIKTFLKWAHNEGYCRINLANRIKTPKPSKSVRKYLTITDIENIRRACKDTRERALVEFLLSTGCRVSEVVGLKFSDIVDDTILIRGKGDKERLVFINEKSKLYLDLYRTNKGYISDYIFDTPRSGHKYIEQRAIQKILSSIGDRYEMHIHPHRFRHSFASLLYQHNMPLPTIQELLGHENISTTQTYAKSDMRKIKNEYDQHSII